MSVRDTIMCFRIACLLSIAVSFSVSSLESQQEVREFVVKSFTNAGHRVKRSHDGTRPRETIQLPGGNNKNMLQMGYPTERQQMQAIARAYQQQSELVNRNQPMTHRVDKFGRRPSHNNAFNSHVNNAQPTNAWSPSEPYNSPVPLRHNAFSSPVNNARHAQPANEWPYTEPYNSPIPLHNRAFNFPGIDPPAPDTRPDPRLLPGNIQKPGTAKVGGSSNFDIFGAPIPDRWQRQDVAAFRTHSNTIDVTRNTPRRTTTVPVSVRRQPAGRAQVNNNPTSGLTGKKSQFEEIRRRLLTQHTERLIREVIRKHKLNSELPPLQKFDPRTPSTIAAGHINRLQIRNRPKHFDQVTLMPPKERFNSAAANELLSAFHIANKQVSVIDRPPVARNSVSVRVQPSHSVELMMTMGEKPGAMIDPLPSQKPNTGIQPGLQPTFINSQQGNIGSSISAHSMNPPGPGSSFSINPFVIPGPLHSQQVFGSKIPSNMGLPSSAVPPHIPQQLTVASKPPSRNVHTASTQNSTNSSTPAGWLSPSSSSNQTSAWSGTIRYAGNNTMVPYKFQNANSSTPLNVITATGIANPPTTTSNVPAARGGIPSTMTGRAPASSGPGAPTSLPGPGSPLTLHSPGAPPALPSPISSRTLPGPGSLSLLPGQASPLSFLAAGAPSSLPGIGAPPMLPVPGAQSSLPVLGVPPSLAGPGLPHSLPRSGSTPTLRGSHKQVSPRVPTQPVINLHVNINRPHGPRQSGPPGQYAQYSQTGQHAPQSGGQFALSGQQSGPRYIDQSMMMKPIRTQIDLNAIHNIRRAVVESMAQRGHSGSSTIQRVQPNFTGNQQPFSHNMRASNMGNNPQLRSQQPAHQIPTGSQQFPPSIERHLGRLVRPSTTQRFGSHAAGNQLATEQTLSRQQQFAKQSVGSQMVGNNHPPSPSQNLGSQNPFEQRMNSQSFRNRQHAQNMPNHRQSVTHNTDTFNSAISARHNVPIQPPNNMRHFLPHQATPVNQHSAQQLLGSPQSSTGQQSPNQHGGVQTATVSQHTRPNIGRQPSLNNLPTSQNMGSRTPSQSGTSSSAGTVNQTFSSRGIQGKSVPAHVKTITNVMGHGQLPSNRPSTSRQTSGQKAARNQQSATQQMSSQTSTQRASQISPQNQQSPQQQRASQSSPQKQQSTQQQRASQSSPQKQQSPQQQRASQSSPQNQQPISLQGLGSSTSQQTRRHQTTSQQTTGQISPQNQQITSQQTTGQNSPLNQRTQKVRNTPQNQQSTSQQTLGRGGQSLIQNQPTVSQQTRVQNLPRNQQSTSQNVRGQTMIGVNQQSVSQGTAAGALQSTPNTGGQSSVNQRGNNQPGTTSTNRAISSSSINPSGGHIPNTFVASQIASGQQLISLQSLSGIGRNANKPQTASVPQMPSFDQRNSNTQRAWRNPELPLVSSQQNSRTTSNRIQGPRSGLSVTFGNQIRQVSIPGTAQTGGNIPTMNSPAKMGTSPVYQDPVNNQRTASWNSAQSATVSNTFRQSNVNQAFPNRPGQQSGNPALEPALHTNIITPITGDQFPRNQQVQQRSGRFEHQTRNEWLPFTMDLGFANQYRQSTSVNAVSPSTQQHSQSSGMTATRPFTKHQRQQIRSQSAHGVQNNSQSAQGVQHNSQSIPVSGKQQSGSGNSIISNSVNQGHPQAPKNVLFLNQGRSHGTTNQGPISGPQSSQSMPQLTGQSRKKGGPNVKSAPIGRSWSTASQQSPHPNSLSSVQHRMLDNKQTAKSLLARDQMLGRNSRGQQVSISKISRHKPAFNQEVGNWISSSIQSIPVSSSNLWEIPPGVLGNGMNSNYNKALQHSGTSSGHHAERLFASNPQHSNSLPHQQNTPVGKTTSTSGNIPQILQLGSSHQTEQNTQGNMMTSNSKSSAAVSSAGNLGSLRSTQQSAPGPSSVSVQRKSPISSGQTSPSSRTSNNSPTAKQRHPSPISSSQTGTLNNHPITQQLGSSSSPSLPRQQGRGGSALSGRNSPLSAGVSSQATTSNNAIANSPNNQAFTQQGGVSQGHSIPKPQQQRTGTSPSEVFLPVLSSPRKHGNSVLDKPPLGTASSDPSQQPTMISAGTLFVQTIGSRSSDLSVHTNKKTPIVSSQNEVLVSQRFGAASMVPSQHNSQQPAMISPGKNARDVPQYSNAFSHSRSQGHQQLPMVYSGNGVLDASSTSAIANLQTTLVSSGIGVLHVSPQGISGNRTPAISPISKVSLGVRALRNEQSPMASSGPSALYLSNQLTTSVRPSFHKIQQLAIASGNSASAGNSASGNSASAGLPNGKGSSGHNAITNQKTATGSAGNIVLDVPPQGTTTSSGSILFNNQQPTMISGISVPANPPQSKVSSSVRAHRNQLSSMVSSGGSVSTVSPLGVASTAPHLHNIGQTQIISTSRAHASQISQHSSGPDVHHNYEKPVSSGNGVLDVPPQATASLDHSLHNSKQTTMISSGNNASAVPPNGKSSPGPIVSSEKPVSSGNGVLDVPPQATASLDHSLHNSKQTTMISSGNNASAVPPNGKSSPGPIVSSGNRAMSIPPHDSTSSGPIHTMDLGGNSVPDLKAPNVTGSLGSIAYTNQQRSTISPGKSGLIASQSGNNSSVTSVQHHQHPGKTVSIGQSISSPPISHQRSVTKNSRPMVAQQSRQIIAKQRDASTTQIPSITKKQGSVSSVPVIAEPLHGINIIGIFSHPEQVGHGSSGTIPREYIVATDTHSTSSVQIGPSAPNPHTNIETFQISTNINSLSSGSNHIAGSTNGTNRPTVPPIKLITLSQRQETLPSNTHHLSNASPRPVLIPTVTTVSPVNPRNRAHLVNTTVVRNANTAQSDVTQTRSYKPAPHTNSTQTSSGTSKPSSPRPNVHQSLHAVPISSAKQLSTPPPSVTSTLGSSHLQGQLSASVGQSIRKSSSTLPQKHVEPATPSQLGKPNIPVSSPLLRGLDLMHLLEQHINQASAPNIAFNASGPRSMSDISASAHSAPVMSESAPHSAPAIAESAPHSAPAIAALAPHLAPAIAVSVSEPNVTMTFPVINPNTTRPTLTTRINEAKQVSSSDFNVSIHPSRPASNIITMTSSPDPHLSVVNQTGLKEPGRTTVASVSISHEHIAKTKLPTRLATIIRASVSKPSAQSPPQPRSTNSPSPSHQGTPSQNRASLLMDTNTLASNGSSTRSSGSKQSKAAVGNAGNISGKQHNQFNSPMSMTYPVNPVQTKVNSHQEVNSGYLTYNTLSNQTSNTHKALSNTTSPTFLLMLHQSVGGQNGSQGKMMNSTQIGIPPSAGKSNKPVTSQTTRTVHRKPVTAHQQRIQDEAKSVVVTIKAANQAGKTPGTTTTDSPNTLMSSRKKRIDGQNAVSAGLVNAEHNIEPRNKTDIVSTNNSSSRGTKGMAFHRTTSRVNMRDHLDHIPILNINIPMGTTKTSGVTEKQTNKPLPWEFAATESGIISKTSGSRYEYKAEQKKLSGPNTVPPVPSGLHFVSLPTEVRRTSVSPHLLTNIITKTTKSTKSDILSPLSMVSTKMSSNAFAKTTKLPVTVPEHHSHIVNVSAGTPNSVGSLVQPNIPGMITQNEHLAQVSLVQSGLRSVFTSTVRVLNQPSISVTRVTVPPSLGPVRAIALTTRASQKVMNSPAFTDNATSVSVPVTSSTDIQ